VTPPSTVQSLNGADRLVVASTVKLATGRLRKRNSNDPLANLLLLINLGRAGTGLDRGTRLTRFGVRLILNKHLAKAAEQHASLKHKRLHPHSVRHSTAVNLLRSGVDLSTIAHWLGHVSVNTTNKYLSLDLDAKREALAKAKPLIKGCRHSAAWRKDRDLIAWLEAL